MPDFNTCIWVQVIPNLKKKKKKSFVFTFLELFFASKRVREILQKNVVSYISFK